MLVCILQTKTNCEYLSFKDFPYVIESTKEIFSFLAASFLKVAFIQKVRCVCQTSKETCSKLGAIFILRT